MEFTSIGSLNSHRPIHTGDKPYQCKICPAKYKWFNSLKSHSEIHIKEKSYKCEFCPKKFGVEVKYKRHVECHTRDKPFVCEICAKQFRKLGHQFKSIFVTLRVLQRVGKQQRRDPTLLKVPIPFSLLFSLLLTIGYPANYLI